MKTVEIKLSQIAQNKLQRIITSIKQLDAEMNDTLVLYASSSEFFDEDTKISLSNDVTSITLHKVGNEDKVITEEIS